MTRSITAIIAKLPLVRKDRRLFIMSGKYSGYVREIKCMNCGSAVHENAVKKDHQSKKTGTLCYEKLLADCNTPG